MLCSGTFFSLNWLLYPQQGGKCCAWALLRIGCFILSREGSGMFGHFCELAAFILSREENAQVGEHFLITGRTAVITFLVMHKRYQRQGHFCCDRRGAGEDASKQGPRVRTGT